MKFNLPFSQTNYDDYGLPSPCVSSASSLPCGNLDHSHPNPLNNNLKTHRQRNFGSHSRGRYLSNFAPNFAHQIAPAKTLHKIISLPRNVGRPPSRTKHTYTTSAGGVLLRLPPFEDANPRRKRLQKACQSSPCRATAPNPTDRPAE